MTFWKRHFLICIATCLRVWVWFCQHLFGTQIPQPPERLLNCLFNHNRLHILEFLADVYFPCGIFRFQNRLYLIDPKLALKAGSKLGKGASDYLFNSPLKHSILNVKDKALDFRHIIAASLRKSKMEEKRGQMKGIVDKAVFKMADMDVVDMSIFTLKISLDIIGQVIFGIDLGALEGKQEPLRKAMDTVFYRCCALGQLSFDSDEFMESGKTIQAVAESILTKCEGQPKDDHSFVDLISRNAESFEQAWSTLGTFLIVGSETLSTILSLMLRVLAERSHLQKELQEEADEWIGRVQTDFSNVPPKLESAIKELLRMYSIGPYITRRADTDMNLGRFIIPAKSDLRIFLWGMHKSHVWPDSKSYCFDRFCKASSTNQSPAFFPFGAGPRMCPGQNLAWIALSLLMTYFMHDFNFLRVSQTRDLDVCVDWEHTVLYPSCHVFLGVQNRSKDGRKSMAAKTC